MTTEQRAELLHQLPPRGLMFPAQRGYCDICQIERTAAHPITAVVDARPTKENADG